MSNLVSLRDVVQFHYGSALKAEDRDETGEFDVFGSNGPVGRHSKRLVDYPTIVIGRKGSVGSVYYAKNGGWPIDTAYYTEILDQRQLDLRYLFYALNQAGLDRHTIVTSIPGLNRDALYGTKIPLPPLPEQKRIADILDKAEGIRRKRREADDQSDVLLRSAFHDWFGDPVTNSKGLPTDKLGFAATLDRGRSRHRPRDASFLYGGPYPFVQTGDIANSNGYIKTFTQTYSEEGLAQSKLWPKGTLCITIAANIAKTGILTFDSCFPDSVVGLIPGTQLTTEYVRYWFVAMEKAIDASATQVAQKNINLETLRDLNIQLPPKSSLQRFTSLVRKIQELRTKEVTATKVISDLFDSIVQRAFRGEL